MPETQGTLTLVDPRERFPKPPFSEQQKVPPPGSDEDLIPRADYGETSYTGRARLTGRIALITGGDSGIGRAVALCFAKEGADVLFTCLAEEQRDADETIRLVEAQGRRAISYPGDVTKKTFCAALVNRAIEEFGRLDILVNNAAYQRTYGELEDIPEEEFETTFQTNVFGPFYMMKEAIAEMKPGGVVINTVSIQTFEPGAELPAYAASKAALASLTKSFAKMAMKHGIRINGVAPGPVWTPFIPTTMRLEKVQQFGSSTVFERPAQPVEQAAIFVFLASDDASYVTGEIYGATGGKTPL